MDTSYLLDWANLLLRWAHVITAIAWIGSSFYFVWLDDSLERRPARNDLPDNVDGELWSVHGGGFYQARKFLTPPAHIPGPLHWFYWESYSTWLTGFGLLTVLYLLNATSFLVDKSVADWTPAQAVGMALGYLVAGWVVYDLICKLFGEMKHGDAIVGALVALYVVAASWLAAHWFAGRAAFVLTGAMLATIMSANVAHVIIPGQRKSVAALQAGQKPDPKFGKRGKQRSVHNTFFTLPVLFAMLSNHYSMVWAHPLNWLVLDVLMAAGALIRIYFVKRHTAQPGAWRWAAAGCALIAGVIVWLAPAPRAQVVAELPPPTFAEVTKIVGERCVLCHNPQLASKGVMLNTRDNLLAHAQQVYQMAVVQKLMPMNNATGITDEERALLGRWYLAGAKGD
ncbi:urate hydroxylase PuuD [Derxia gummosa]|uniref:Urate hydroxylase PuuD n=1 Tax=Derxia gummosa DSM 723 TaxID=1121388 RepID=A0A8B6X6G4_9BURK|nr:urate hydroxylase PuuD [Derxia gummosa]